MVEYIKNYHWYDKITLTTKEEKNLKEIKEKVVEKLKSFQGLIFIADKIYMI